ncbi:unnamed protein product [Auanema sp. JU1783]|nr:unnamed protein product [Auanema sp. JU1783]
MTQVTRLDIRQSYKIKLLKASTTQIVPTTETTTTEAQTTSSSTTSTTTTTTTTSTTTVSSTTISRPTTHAPPVKVKPFVKKRETAHIDCARALNGDKKYMKEIAKKRITLETDPPLDKVDTCEVLRARLLPPAELKPLKVPTAFARIVYKSYIFIEDEFKSAYHPNNTFCYSIDKKADAKFHQRIKQLANCFDNVMITPVEFSVDGSGHFMNHAHYECLKLILKRKQWGYALLLQNHDTITKNVYDLSAVYDELAGANDAELTHCPSGRYDPKEHYDARSLKLFRNESLATAKQLNATLQFAKGATQVSLSRAAVDWLVNTVDLTNVINVINKMSFGVDEVLMLTLQNTQDLEMPGHFHNDCLEHGKGTDFISRMSHWAYSGEKGCATNHIRHAICVLGLEDLTSLSIYPNVMANKFLPEFDYAGFDCLHEMLYNQTYYNQQRNFDMSYYSQMASVRYHKEHQKNPEAKPVCDAKFRWQNQKYP